MKEERADSLLCRRVILELIDVDLQRTLVPTKSPEEHSADFVHVLRRQAAEDAVGPVRLARFEEAEQFPIRRLVPTWKRGMVQWRRGTKDSGPFTCWRRLHCLEVQLDQLFVKIGALLVQLQNDVLEVLDADISPEGLEVCHDGMTRERFNFLEVGAEDLEMRRTSAELGAIGQLSSYMQTSVDVLLEDPSRGVEDDGQMRWSEFLEVAHGRFDLPLRVVLVLAHPASS